MKKIINKKVYDTETAKEIATNDYSDVSNRLNNGRSSTLYQTKKGNYFLLTETCWQGEHDNIEPLTKDEAVEEWAHFHNQCIEFEEAFPDVKTEEA